MVDQTHSAPSGARNAVDDVMAADAAGATFVQTASGKWAAKDSDGAFVVIGAESLAEAARMYCEDRGPTPSTPDAILAGIKAEYAPYDAMPEFQEGYSAYRIDGAANFRRNPYDDGVKAQAWSRGADAARRFARTLSAADRGGVVEAARRPSSNGRT